MFQSLGGAHHAGSQSLLEERLRMAKQHVYEGEAELISGNVVLCEGRAHLEDEIQYGRGVTGWKGTLECSAKKSPPLFSPAVMHVRLQPSGLESTAMVFMSHGHEHTYRVVSAPGSPAFW
jgi:hypothetical protein